MEQNINDVTSELSCFKVSAMRKALQISKDISQNFNGTNGTDSSCLENRENEQNSCNVQNGQGGSEMSNKASIRKGITFSTQKIMLENELQRKESVRRNIQLRKQEMEKSLRVMQEKIALLRINMANERERKDAEMLARIQAEEEQIARQEEIRRKHELQLQAQRLLEQKEKLRKEEEQFRKRVKEKEEILEKIGFLKGEFRAKYRDIGMISKACKDKNSVSVILTPYLATLKKLCQQMEVVNEKIKTGDVTYEDLSIVEFIVNQTDEILHSFKSEIEQVDALYVAEVARAEEQAKLAEAQLQQEHQAQLAALQATPEVVPVHQEPVHNIPENRVECKEDLGDKQRQDGNKSSSIESLAQSGSADTTPTQQPQTPPIEESAEARLYEYVDKESLQIYINSKVLLEVQEKNLEEFMRSDSTKKFRFEYQKAIKIPMNAISAVNEHHLRDKYERVHNLLTGKTNPNPSQYPQGTLYCQKILAQTLVSLGETLVDTKPKAAFPVAAVAVAIWNDHAEFGNLFLAYFHKICPFTVPVYLPQEEGSPPEEYYKFLGYKYSDDGTVEEQNKFLKRMSGVMRLYASVMVTRQRKGVTKDHPYGLQNAWRWFAAVLNTAPRPEVSDIYATLILIMLEITGNALWNAYPKQFPKLLVALANEYYPQMQKANDNCGGPFERLELFLRNVLTKGSIPPPDGQLPPNFW